MKVVEGALRDAILDFDGALDVLLLGELHLIVIDALRLVPLGRCQSLNHTVFGTLHLVKLALVLVLTPGYLLVKG